MKRLILIALMVAACGSEDNLDDGRPKLTIASHSVEFTKWDDGEWTVNFSASLSQDNVQHYQKRFAVNVGPKVPVDCNAADHVESVFAGVMQLHYQKGTTVSYRTCAHDTKSGYMSEGKTDTFVVE